MASASFHFFKTDIGYCAIVWRGSVVAGAALPEAGRHQAILSLQRRFPGAVERPPLDDISATVDAIIRLLAGQDEDLSSIPLDLSAVGPFERSVLAAALRIPRGEIRTYGEIASDVGAPGAARAVGRALGANPVPIIVPCHRVLGADGRSGGFSAPGGASTKLRILEIEGARRGPEPELFDRLPWRAKPV